MEEMQNVNMNAPKKKGKKKIIIIVSVIVVIVGFIGIDVVRSIKAMSGAMQAQMEAMEGSGSVEDTYTVERQDVEQEIVTTGNTVGVEVEAYTSPVTAKVDSICVEVGQTVQKGDVLLTYDAKDLGDNLEKVKIQARSERAAGNASFEEANKAASRADKANSKADELEDEIKDLKKDIEKSQKTVDKYEKKIKNASKPTTEAVTEVPEDEKESTTGEEDASTQEVKQEPTTEAVAEKDPLTKSERKEYNKAVTNISKKTESLQTKQAELEKQKSIAESNEDVTVSESTKVQVNAANELSDMSVNEAQESYDAASAGIVVEKKGIVQSVDVIKGSFASEGQTVFTIIDSNKIGVEFVVSQSYIGSIAEGQKVRINISGKEYDGTVQYISRVAASSMASDDVSGGQITGRVLIDNPDDDLFIGVNAKVYIFVGKAENALTIPYEALCTDKNGDYVYVVNKENLIERKDITVGLYSDEYFEVTEGIEEGDTVIRNVTSEMKPGDSYTSDTLGMPVME